MVLRLALHPYRMFDDMKSRAAKRLHDPQRPAMLRA
jgi:hypothetical protein